MVRILAEAALIFLIVAGYRLESISKENSGCGRFLNDEFCNKERETSGPLFENFFEIGKVPGCHDSGKIGSNRSFWATCRAPTLPTMTMSLLQYWVGISVTDKHSSGLPNP